MIVKTTSIEYSLDMTGVGRVIKLIYADLEM